MRAASGAVFALGTTTVDCTATDSHGNTSNASFEILVQDTTAPTLSLPGNLTAEATSAAGAAVSFAASADDLVDGPVTVICSPASGTVFALATTEVNCSATDAAGNTRLGSFTVKVQDTTPPTASVPGDIVEEATGPAGGAVTFTTSAGRRRRRQHHTDLHAVVGKHVPDRGHHRHVHRYRRPRQYRQCSVHGHRARHDRPGDRRHAHRHRCRGDRPRWCRRHLHRADRGRPGRWSRPCGVRPAIGEHVPARRDDDGGLLGVRRARATAAPRRSACSWATAPRPVLTLPADFTVEATGPTGAMVSFTATSNDLVDGNAAANACLPPVRHSRFGPHTINCTATDAHENTSSGSFTVTVEDTTAPSAQRCRRNIRQGGDRSIRRCVTFSASASDASTVGRA